jgi:hypothetical protein
MSSFNIYCLLLCLRQRLRWFVFVTAPARRRSTVALELADNQLGSLMTSLIAMDYFKSTFNAGTTGTMVAVIFSLYAV